MAFDGHVGAHASSAHGLLGLSLDLDAMMAAENALPPGFDRLFAPCTHDDACLDHHSHLRQPRAGRKAQPGFAPRLQSQAPATSLRPQARTPPLPLQNHSTSPLATPSLVEDQPQGYAWDTFLNDSALDNAAALHHSGFGLRRDPDCASECSSECDGACPSQCGDTGHGICCDDDACGSLQLCLDQDCQGASRPCMDESCLTDTTLVEDPGHAMTDGDKAAAAALASFGGDSQLQMVQAALMQPPASASPAPGGGPSSFSHLPESLPCGSLSMLTNGLPGFPNQAFQVAPELALASHILQYHDPSRGLAHSGTCVANDPGQLISRCTLPKFDADDGAMNPYLSQVQGHECGFQVQDPTAFAQHIFQDHKPAFAPQPQPPKFPGLSYPLTHAGSNASPRRRSRTEYHAASQAPCGRHFSQSPSPLTNLSVGHSLSTTPSSLPTPSPLGSDAGVAEPSVPEAPKSPLAASDNQPLTQEDRFLCRWLTGDGDGICGKHFDDDEQLQKHCKLDHLKQLKKARGGFRCGWASCTRDTCFTQRSKVERHMQVHTGCESATFRESRLCVADSEQTSLCAARYAARPCRPSRPSNST